MYVSNKKAFTILELTFVIVIIGILSAIAVPKFAATRDDALITKAISTVAAVRNAIATEKQKRILRGDFNAITDLASSNSADSPIFDFFDINTTRVLEYPLRSCLDGNTRGCWTSTSDTIYIYRMPSSTNNITFTLSGSRFNCDSSTGVTAQDCRTLTE